MRRLVLLAPAVALVAGCGATVVSGTASPSPPSASASAGAAAADLPPAPEPGSTAQCPYLKSDFVADSNGQHVSKVRVSADRPHPACFFYRPDGKIQLTVQVYVGTGEVATGLVNRAAPIDSSNPANDPTGWKGGYEPTDDGAVYAVAKGPNAVIVTTNQKQSIKARTVAKQAIAALKL